MHAKPNGRPFLGRVEVIFEDFGRETCARVPDARWTTGHSSNAAFPLRAFLRLSRTGEDAHAVVVVSLDCHRDSDEKVSVSVDVEHESGLVISSLPTQELRVGEAVPDLNEQASRLLPRIEAFLRDQVRVVSDALMRGHPPANPVLGRPPAEPPSHEK